MTLRFTPQNEEGSLPSWLTLLAAFSFLASFQLIDSSCEDEQDLPGCRLRNTAPGIDTKPSVSLSGICNAVQREFWNKWGSTEFLTISPNKTGQVALFLSLKEGKEKQLNKNEN